MASFHSGVLALYHGKTATVSAVTKDKIEIRIEGGSTKSVRPKDLEYLHPGPVSALPPKTLPEPNLEELLELIEGETLPFPEFAELAYGNRSADAFYSAWLLLEDGTYFTGSVESGVTPRPRAEIDAALAAAREKEEIGRASCRERV